MYNSLILATWYKKKIRGSILSQVYADKNKVAGVNIDDPKEKERIYQRYLNAFKKGVYNYIKEEAISSLGMTGKQQGILPRKYFSGGILWDMDGKETFISRQPDNAQLGHPGLLEVSSDLAMIGPLNIENKPLKPDPDGLISRRKFIIGAGAGLAFLAAREAMKRGPSLYNTGAIVLSDVEDLRAREAVRELPNGFYQIGRFFTDRPTVVMLPGARWKKLIWMEKYLKKFEMKKINILVFKYDYKDDVEEISKKFREEFLRGMDGHFTPRISILAFSYGGNVVADSILQVLKSKGRNFFKNIHLAFVSTPLAGSISARLTVNPFFGPIWKGLSNLDTSGMADFINNLKPGNRLSMEFERDFDFIMANIGSYQVFIGGKDPYLPLSGTKGHESTGNEMTDKEFTRMENKMIFSHAKIYPELSHKDMLAGVSEGELSDITQYVLGIDHAQLAESPGGIDLTPFRMDLQTQSNGAAINFHLDPATLKQLQNAFGFVPVIINIQPMTDLREFLGLTNSS